MQTFSHPANSTIEWTEYIMAMEGANPEALHGDSYSDALDEMKTFLDSPKGMPKEMILEMHTKLKEMAAQPLHDADIMHPGQPWGALEMLRQSKAANGEQAREFVWPASAAFAFDGWKESPQAKPWVELLEVGEFSPSTLSLQYPPSYQVSEAWMTLVGHSKPSWLRSLYLGVAAAENAGTEAQQQPDFAEARAHFEESYAKDR